MSANHITWPWPHLHWSTYKYMGCIILHLVFRDCLNMFMLPYLFNTVCLIVLPVIYVLLRLSHTRIPVTHYTEYTCHTCTTFSVLTLDTVKLVYKGTWKCALYVQLPVIYRFKLFVPFIKWRKLNCPLKEWFFKTGAI